VSLFKFKKFDVIQSNAPQKVGTDAMVLGALVKPLNIDLSNPPYILDVGTGCGVIALMLAQKFPNAKITGIDIDAQAVLQAKFNFENTNFLNHFQTLSANFLEYHPNHKFDLIVSNPPYFNSKMPPANQQRSLARHENSMTLKDLINHSAKLLNEAGELWIIVPSERTEDLIKENLALDLLQRIKINGKPNRHVRDVLVFSHYKNELTDNVVEFTIRDDHGQYTEEYKELTYEFHYNSL